MYVQFQLKRVLQYVLDLGDSHLFKSKVKKLQSQQHDPMSDDNCFRKIPLFMDKHVARHFLMHVELTKRILAEKR